MTKNWLDIKRELQDLGKNLLEHNLTWGNAGNISAKTANETFLITASGTNLGNLQIDDFVECNINGSLKEGNGKKPSKEVPMHRAIYETRSEIGAIIHASPFYSTFVACTDFAIKKNCFVESMYYLERIERIPYAHPGSEKLGELVKEKASYTNILLLENHGVLVYDTNLKEAMVTLLTLETACHMSVLAGTSDIQLNELPEAVVTSFLNDSEYKPRRMWGN